MQQKNIEEEKNLPEKKFKAGAISATVWRNAGLNQQGQPTEYKTISFERRYKDKTGDWKTAGSLRVMDVPKAILVLHKAYEYTALSNTDSEESL